MPEIVLPAQRYRKSSRGTPRLRRLLRTLHGALRLAMSTTTLLSDCADVLLTRRRAESLRCFSLGLYSQALSSRSATSCTSRPLRPVRSIWIIPQRQLSGQGEVDLARIMSGSR